MYTRMVHTSVMRLFWYRTAIWLSGLALAGSIAQAEPRKSPADSAREAARWQNAVGQMASKNRDVRVLVIQISSEAVLASAQRREAAQALATPGSTLKPLILYYAISSGHWNAEQRIACRREMRIGSHQLNCSHPEADPMDAEQALTWSCNSYFAALAATLSPEELRRALSVRGLLAASEIAPDGNVAEFPEPRTRSQVQLAALGVEGIRVTLPELAQAYRSLAIEFSEHPQSAATRTVRAGLADSASFGMAGAASLGGVPVAGKTGTASAESGGGTHGWFIGMAPAQAPEVVIAVYLPAGRGADAAQVAAGILARSPLQGVKP